MTGPQLGAHFKTYNIIYKDLFYKEMLPFRRNPNAPKDLIAYLSYNNICDEECPQVNIDRSTFMLGTIVDFFQR